ncbi:MAG: hypothetical protein KJO49_04710 [Bacteroidia bacterium]|nr:hypothetical protein [Bacteroidia bacterium]MBT8269214.1 hypothetical protein [Bacteroidia bacterium]NNK70485.1 hypothetical protein [Flavobacteriaceae bacterium]NNL79994.1 hypothetical protein [Flavobacteriaceae bacterium]
MPKQISIQIDHALYGIQGHTLDVTEAAQNALMGDDLTVSAKRLGVEDPAPGEMKFFAVKATITIDNDDSQSFHYIAKDYETIDFIP